MGTQHFGSVLLGYCAINYGSACILKCRILKCHNDLLVKKYTSLLLLRPGM